MIVLHILLHLIWRCLRNLLRSNSRGGTWEWKTERHAKGRRCRIGGLQTFKGRVREAYEWSTRQLPKVSLLSMGTFGFLVALTKCLIVYFREFETKEVELSKALVALKKRCSTIEKQLAEEVGTFYSCSYLTLFNLFFAIHTRDPFIPGHWKVESSRRGQAHYRPGYWAWSKAPWGIVFVNKCILYD